jgi:large subunit ribosomal protein L1
MAHKRITKRAKANAEIGKTVNGPLAAPEAVAALKKFKGPKFDQTVNICMHLGIDTAQADQNLRGAISLPKGIGKTKRVVAFCQSDVAPKAIAAGAVKAGAEELVAEIEKGWMDFDVAVASPDMMRIVSKLGKVLGPKGLMPSPKAGTVTPNIPDAVKEYSAGKVEYRADKGGTVHAVIGKMSFPTENLVANLEYFITAIEKVRPATAKGIYIKRVTLSGAMTPGIQVKYVSAEVAAE